MVMIHDIVIIFLMITEKSASKDAFAKWIVSLKLLSILDNNSFISIALSDWHRILDDNIEHLSYDRILLRLQISRIQASNFKFMSKLAIFSVTVFCLLGALGLQAKANDTITIESLLHEMVDRDSIARFPQAEFRLKQDSSYNRKSTSPADTKGWFLNKDYNSSEKDKNFIRIEENHSRDEWVVMEDEGPGAVVRIWVPWRGQSDPKSEAIVRFYLDGSLEPAIEGNLFDLFQGQGLIRFPLAHPSLRSAVSFFPIPYAKSCKVTVSERPFFYQFTYRSYIDNTSVKTFTMGDFEKAKETIDATCSALLQPKKISSSKELKLSGTLAPGEKSFINLPTGEAAIRGLSVKLGSYDDPEITRNVVLSMSFDGKDTVWCPVGDFFGTGIGLHPFQGWYRNVAEDGVMSCRWTMPYRESGKIEITNYGSKPVDFELEGSVSDWNWDASSMYFHSGWRGEYPVATRPYSDWNYVNIKGRGVFVGDTLTVMNPVEKWWGEGDEKIFVDGESFPSIFGTGTEDYYAYSWGGISNDFYEHPFHAQPRANVYNKLNRKISNDKNTKGFSTETRSRALDTMPFSRSLQLDMEVWSWTDCNMAYGVGVYWYGDASTTSNHQPDPEGVLAVPSIP